MQKQNSDTSSSDEEDEVNTKNPSSQNNVRQKYTLEQKIVSAVWVHERQFNGQTFEDIRTNFLVRFKVHPPNGTTLVRWETRLFSEGTVKFCKDKRQRPLKRLMHVPYVKASFREKPNITLSERANQLGLAKDTLRKIMKYDLKESDIRPQKDENIYGDVENKQDDNNFSKSETVKAN
ncbi:hypothetical protein NQ314_008696 [Rhamnusium bicolor]|uniref:DUF4817 domain-containing protein n=1 Tax=Rhamnusium bicolor TaxID=1586634 RepID=A0AAV8Y7Q9_9CUCU|nr:hypothetical protein NQ314_008696 [Rhamnusium bicolor]